MANEEPKKFSEELKALRAEFNDLADKAKKTVARLDSAIFKQELLEIRQEHDKVVTEFAVPGSLESVNNRDISILVNKSKDMGTGLNSPVGQGLDAASRLHLAVNRNYDISVSGGLWDTGSSKSVNLGDNDRLEKARDKTETNNKDLVPTLREIMISNTPDKANERSKHYIIVSGGSITDNVEHAVQMIEATLLYNKKATFDFITVGNAAGNVAEIALKANHSTVAERVGFHKAEKAEDIWATVTGVLKNRVAASPYVKPAPAAPAPTATPTP
jgi:hypothetical protein